MDADEVKVTRYAIAVSSYNLQSIFISESVILIHFIVIYYISFFTSTFVLRYQISKKFCELLDGWVQDLYLGLVWFKSGNILYCNLMVLSWRTTLRPFHVAHSKIERRGGERERKGKDREKEGTRLMREKRENLRERKGRATLREEEEKREERGRENSYL